MFYCLNVPKSYYNYNHISKRNLLVSDCPIREMNPKSFGCKVVYFLFNIEQLSEIKLLLRVLWAVVMIYLTNYVGFFIDGNPNSFNYNFYNIIATKFPIKNRCIDSGNWTRDLQFKSRHSILLPLGEANKKYVQFMVLIAWQNTCDKFDLNNSLWICFVLRRIFSLWLNVSVRLIVHTAHSIWESI